MIVAQTVPHAANRFAQRLDEVNVSKVIINRDEYALTRTDRHYETGHAIQYFAHRRKRQVVVYDTVTSVILTVMTEGPVVTAAYRQLGRALPPVVKRESVTVIVKKRRI